MFKTKKSFRKEFRRQIKYAIIAAVGFIIAFSWRNAIYDSIYSRVQLFLEYSEPIATDFVTAAVITLIGVCIIFITSKIFRD